MNSNHLGIQGQSIFGRQPLLVLGIIVLMPLLAIFTLVYFGIHHLRNFTALEKKPIVKPVSFGIFNRETVSAR